MGSPPYRGGRFARFPLELLRLVPGRATHAEQVEV